MDSSIMPAKTMLDMATRNGAKALHTNAGSIKPGSKADLIIMDLSSHHFTCYSG